MADPGTASSGWAVGKAVWSRAQEWWARGRKVADLFQRVATLQEDVASLKAEIADLKRHAGIRPSDVQVEKELGVHSGVVGAGRHYFCPVCAGKDEWMLLQHEPRGNPPWRCPNCHLCFPGGYRRIPRTRVVSMER